MKKAIQHSAKEAFYAVQPLHIRTCDSLEHFHQDNQILTVPVDQFVAQRYQRYCSSILLRESQLKSVWNDKTQPKRHVTELEQQLFDESYTDRFVVVNMGDIGEGLFLAHDAQPIAMGSLVLMYAGEFDNSIDDKFREYGIVLDPIFQHEKHSVLMHSFTLPWLDAERAGNLSRFIQHAPDQMDLDKVEDPAEIKSKVAVANLQQRVVIYQGVPTVCLQAARDIQPGEILTFSYGQAYFQHAGSCQLVTDNGVFIGQLSKSTIEPREISDEKLKALPDAARLNPIAYKQKLMQPFQTAMVHDNAEQFTCNVRHVLTLASEMSSGDSKKKIDLIRRVFDASKDIAQRYKIVQNSVDKGVFCADEFSAERRFLVKLCKWYASSHNASKVKQLFDLAAFGK